MKIQNDPNPNPKSLMEQSSLKLSHLGSIKLATLIPTPLFKTTAPPTEKLPSMLSCYRLFSGVLEVLLEPLGLSAQQRQ
jgi:hypothetical protein